VTHAEAERSFDAYFASTLDRAQVRGLHLHLKDCEACQARVRLQNALGHAQKRRSAQALTSPEVQAAMARNRDLLVKILLLLALAWGATRLHR
jgi:hypothetical protein